MKKKTSFGKKLAFAVTAFFGLFIAAAIIVPLVVDVDKYRPLIVSKANERLSGKLELGRLGLSLWGRIRVDVDGMKLSDAAGRTFLEVKDASFDLPLWSLLTGSPKARIELDRPLISVVKQKDGKLNVMSVMKASAAVSASGSGQAGRGTGAASQVEIPGLVMSSRLTLLINGARVAYKDEITGDDYKIDDLSFHLEDVSPAGSMPFEIKANLDLLAQKKIRIVGPLVFKGRVHAKSSGDGELDQADFEASVDLSDLELSFPRILSKAKGVLLGADVQGTLGRASFDVPKIRFRLADVSIDGQASGRAEGETTSIALKAYSNAIDVAKLSGLSPMVKEYGINGLLELAVSASGPTTAIGYDANVKFSRLKFSHETMKQAVELNGALAIATNQVKSLAVKASAKDFDLSLEGGVQDFAVPRFKLAVRSNMMDLDALLKASAQAAEQRKVQANQASKERELEASARPKEANVVDYNAAVKVLRANPVVSRAAGVVSFNLDKIKTTGVTIDGLKGELALNERILQLRGLSMRMFGGSVKGSMSFNGRDGSHDAKPEIAANLVVAGLDTQRMAASAMPLAHDSIKGVVDATVNVGGFGLNWSDVVSGWKGGGGIEFKDAEFKTLAIGRQIRDGVITKLPEPLRGKVRVPDKVLDHEGRYQVMAIKFGMSSGTLNVSEINGKAYPNQGFDLKGGGAIGLGNYALNMTVDIVDSYDLLNAGAIAKDNRYGHFALSPKVGGSLLSPKFDWNATLAKLATDVVKSQAQKQAQDAVRKNLDKLPGGLGKIFGGGDSNQQKQPQQQQKPADAVRGALKGLFGK